MLSEVDDVSVVTEMMTDNKVDVVAEIETYSADKLGNPLLLLLHVHLSYADNQGKLL